MSIDKVDQNSSVRLKIDIEANEVRFANSILMASEYINIKTGYVADIVAHGFIDKVTVQMARAQLAVMLGWRTAGEVEELMVFKRHVNGAIRAIDMWLRLKKAADAKARAENA